MVIRLQPTYRKNVEDGFWARLCLFLQAENHKAHKALKTKRLANDDLNLVNITCNINARVPMQTHLVYTNYFILDSCYCWVDVILQILADLKKL